MLVGYVDRLRNQRGVKQRHDLKDAPPVANSDVIHRSRQMPTRPENQLAHGRGQGPKTEKCEYAGQVIPMLVPTNLRECEL